MYGNPRVVDEPDTVVFGLELLDYLGVPADVVCACVSGDQVVDVLDTDSLELLEHRLSLLQPVARVDHDGLRFRRHENRRIGLADVEMVGCEHVVGRFGFGAGTPRENGPPDSDPCPQERPACDTRARRHSSVRSGTTQFVLFLRPAYLPPDDGCRHADTARSAPESWPGPGWRSHLLSAAGSVPGAHIPISSAGSGTGMS